MGKINIEFRPESGQRPVGRIHQGVCGCIIHRSEPFAFEYSPQSLGNIQVWAIWRQEKQEQSPFLPYRSEFGNEFSSMDTCVVKNNKGIPLDFEGKAVKKVCDFIGCNAFGGREAFITVITVNHSKNVEPISPLGRYIDILTGELPAVWHISLSADMALITVIKVYESIICLSFEFLQLLGLIRIELRRGLPLGTFSYTSISRANADKKALNVLSLASFPDAFCHASLAFITLCLSCSMALRTASSSEQSIIGLRPRPGRVSNPEIPSVSKRFTQEFTEIWVMSVCNPISFEVRPCDFNRTVRQRIRYAWLLPLRKPSSSCRRCLSVSCITLIFAIVVSVYAYNAQTYAKILI